MNNNSYYYNLTTLEEELRHYWSAKFEKINFFEVDLSDVNFELKYYSLLNDYVYKSESDFDDGEVSDHNII
jgi:hypothetical protein